MTVHVANIDTSLKLNHLKMLVTGKAKEVMAGLGYTGDRYDVAWNTLVAHFGSGSQGTTETHLYLSTRSIL